MSSKSEVRILCILLGHKFLYFAGYYRKCSQCGEEESGWGSKRLTAGDQWGQLEAICKSSPHTQVNPDNFRAFEGER